MEARDRHIAGAVRAHRRLLERLDVLTDDLVGQPSLLPGWTVGHALAHLARNADSHLRILVAASGGDVVDQYPDGAAGRAAEIERDAARPAADHRADVARTAAQLEQAWRDATERTWAGHGRSVTGDPIACTDLPFRRWRETVVHHADLGHVDARLGLRPADWPGDYVREEHQRLAGAWASRRSMGLTELPVAVRALAEHDRVAWLLGRLQLDGVDAAGVM
jgi:maleylpyruvate isomerase